MTRKDSWSWTRRTFIKTSVAGALLAGYKLLWPSAAQAGSLTPTTQHTDHNIIHKVETDPFGVAGLGESGVRKSRLGFELCPGRSDFSNEH
ncbi:MAG TPA: hypothetical protein PLO50_04525 [Nitrospira sp.]|nr:hypothetical protein [Nitrospira sp.]